jgi:cell wall-associated NlpC family hydrolase
VAKALLRTVAGMVAVLVVTFVGVLVLMMMSTPGDQTPSGSGGAGLCSGEVNGIGQVRGLDADQLGNARTIIAVGRSLGVSDHGLVVALATAMQESTLRNLPYGDRDSLGLFQQRPSAGWGSVSELTTPQVAAQKFFRVLLQVPGWDAMPVTVAAQRVQRSAFPLAYAKWEPLATAIVQAAGGNVARLDCTTPIGWTAPSGAVGDMLRVALGQQGKPYVWGATGPDAFDCSGLVVYSWRMAGFRSTVRTSQQMYAVSDQVPIGSEQPGDLLFGHFDAGGPGHVMIVVRPGLAVQAPRTGDVVKLTPYTAAGGWVIGRLRPGVLEPLPQSG